MMIELMVSTALGPPNLECGLKIGSREETVSDFPTMRWRWKLCVSKGYEIRGLACRVNRGSRNDNVKERLLNENCRGKLF